MTRSMLRRPVTLQPWASLVLVAVTALIIGALGLQLAGRHDADRERAELIAGGTAFAAASAIGDGQGRARLAAAEEAQNRHIAIFLFDSAGRQLTPSRSNGVSLAAVDLFPDAIAAALEGRRLVETLPDGRGIVVALPLESGRAEALIGVVARSDLLAEPGLPRRWAVLLLAGAAAGLAAILAAIAAQRHASGNPATSGRRDPDLDRG
jgi:hypothetical protein